MFDELSPSCFEFLLQCDHPVLFTFGRRSAVKNAACDMHHRECRGICFHHLLAESYQPADMIRVIVRQDHLSDIGQINLQVACILQHGVGMGSSIQQNAMTIGFDKRRKSPLA
jgi:hypothetical protein